MKLPWKRKCEVVDSSPQPVADPPTQPTATRGTAARRTAVERLTEAQAQWPEVQRVAETLRTLREENHFAANIRNIFLGGQPE